GPEAEKRTAEAVSAGGVQPPIWDIDLVGGTKPGSSMPWPAAFDHTTWRQRASRSASEPPARSRSRTDHSRVANRQLRRAPSAVRRRRLQVPQKLSEIGRASCRE